ncbi:MAG: TonB-dependent receptor [Gammaproteobacteria bacterium]|nr:TonB-dependent receptor [Gammaproteobacteria bacterium]MBU1416288.1 TonB-dependent receptor [Gammaproteobacteria bacterium]
MQPRFIAAAIAALGFPQYALAIDDEATVVVTATRFSDADPRIPANISVITQQDIAETPSATLPDILKARAGIGVRTISGSLGIDATTDLRGFGDTAASNTLILLDGQRINPIDMGSISWSAMPLAGVQRIEIIRGAGTVLYGDRASGGVINIITDKTGRPVASIAAEAGSHGYRVLDGHVAGGGEQAYFNLATRYAEDEGWRQNNQQDQRALSGRVGLRLAAGDVFTDFATYRDSSGLPGYLRSAAYADDPRSARTPLDNHSRDGYRLRPGVRFDISGTLTLEAEIGADQENRHGNYLSFGSVSDSRKETSSTTPRLRWRHGLAGLDSETVLGVDYYDGDVESRYSTSPRQTADQTTTSVYFQNSTAFTDAWTLTVGGRRQRMKQSVHQDAYPAWFQPSLDGGATRTQNAGDVGVSYSGDGWRAYGKAGSTYRFANTDELFGYDNVLYVPVFAGDLRPQHGSIGEVGGSIRAGAVDARIAAYRMDLKDEIGYDGSAGANVNFDPTRRQGIEAELGWRSGGGLRAKIAYTYTDAHFREGTYAGNAIPLVSRHMATLQLGWDAGSAGSYDLFTHYVGNRRFSGDFANERDLLPGYTTVDLQAAWKLKAWTMTARVLNAFDKRYAPFAGYSTYISDYYYYPGDGRSIRLAARYDFF